MSKFTDEDHLAVLTLGSFQSIGFGLLFLTTTGIYRFFSSWIIAGIGVSIVVSIIMLAVIRKLKEAQSTLPLMEVYDLEDLLIRSHIFLCMVPLIGIWFAYYPPKILQEMENDCRERKKADLKV